MGVKVPFPLILKDVSVYLPIFPAPALKIDWLTLSAYCVGTYTANLKIFSELSCRGEIFFIPN